MVDLERARNLSLTFRSTNAVGYENAADMIDALVVEVERLREPPDWAPLITLCEQQLDDVQAGESDDDSDLDHYIYEAALTALYGPDIFKWMNARTR